jgi:RNA polymerase sigma factor (sigma-70 family)
LNNQTDQEIIIGCVQNKSAFQRELFYRYSTVLLGTCLRYVGCEEKAKDVLQESFILIFKYIKNYDKSKASIYTWMNKICVNQALKSIKSSYVVLDLNNYEKVEKEDNEPSSQELMEAAELFQYIIELPEPYRTVLNLYEIEGYSHQEISTILELKESSSRSILSRAKKMIIQHLTDLKFQENGLK